MPREEQAGLTVGIAPESVPGPVQLATYRVVQEALVNARRHAPGAPVRVSVDGVAGRTAVRDRERSRPAARHGQARASGSAWSAWRKRVGALDGGLTAGPTGDEAASGSWPRCRWSVWMSEQISVFVVDDEPVIRAGLSAILDSQADITVAGTADDGEKAVEACARLRPDVLLMDIRMPRRDGLWALAELGRQETARAGAQPGAHADNVDLDEYVNDALAAGASGFLLKNSSYEELTGAVRAAAAGHSALSPAVTQRIIEGHLSGRRRTSDQELARLRDLTHGRSTYCV
ncbi:Protein-glutamate methylesterase/protein-glutamine glutaminase [Streptomyces rimosus subsp. rimosus]